MFFKLKKLCFYFIFNCTLGVPCNKDVQAYIFKMTFWGTKRNLDYWIFKRKRSSLPSWEEKKEGKIQAPHGLKKWGSCWTCCRCVVGWLTSKKKRKKVITSPKTFFLGGGGGVGVQQKQHSLIFFLVVLQHASKYIWRVYSAKTDKLHTCTWSSSQNFK